MSSLDMNANKNTPKTEFAGAIDAAASQRLEAWLERYVEGFAGPLRVERFAGGQSNPTFRLSTPAQSYVLRRKPPGELLSSAHQVDREYIVMAALGRAGFPAPKMFALCDDNSVIGSMFYVMELVEGRILWDGRLPHMSAAERTDIYAAQIDTLARLHGIAPVAVGLENFGRSGNYFERQISRWTRQYRASSVGANDDMDRLCEWLPQTAPPEAPARIVHGDYRLDNLILDHQSARVKAVLDWELSTLGDPVADLTYFLMHWETPPAERNSLSGLPLHELGIPTVDEACERYFAQTKLSLARPIEWYFAYNLFRLAAILQGVAGRAKAGQANNERAHQAHGRVGPLAARAWVLARRAEGRL